MADSSTKPPDPDNEMEIWSGPKKPPRSPLKVDKPVTVIDPMVRLPRRTIEGHNRPEGFLADNQDVPETKKMKFTTVTDAVPLRSAPPTIEQQDEDMTFWSGPQKPPRSPIQYDMPILVTDPVVRLPRRSFQRADTVKDPQTNHRDTMPETVGTQKPGVANGTKRSLSLTNRPADVSKRTKQSHSSEIVRKQTASTHMPPRDPLLHKPIVTPPCPIPLAHTPDHPISYTHVSILVLPLYYKY